MRGKNEHQTVKFPENRKYLTVLKRGDRPLLAVLSGLSESSVYSQFYGFRPLSDQLKKALLQLLNDRNSVNEGLKMQLETSEN